MMLDLAGLPKNINGFRTTHTCELCGFEPKTKNKYREKQDHLVMKHFKEKIDKIFPHCRPYACPGENCTFTGKDKQALLRHYTGKHGILERYLREALAEKGINYSPHEGGKRRHSDSSNSSGGSGRSKNPRLSLTPPQQQQQQQQQQQVVASPVAAVVNGTAMMQGNTNGTEMLTAKQVTLPTRPSADDLRKEVEAMMRSFQPVDQPVVLQIPSSSISTVNGTSASTTVAASNALQNGATNGAVVTAIPVIQSATNGNGTVVATAASTATVVPVASLPAIVLSAVANATAATVTSVSPAANGCTTVVSSNGSIVSNGINGANHLNVSLPTQPNNVPTITVASPASSQHQQQQATPVIIPNKLNGNLNLAPVASLIANGPSPSSLPIPLEVIANGTGAKIVSNGNDKLNGNVISVKTITNGLVNGNSSGPNSVSSNGNSSPSSMVEGEDVMWSAVNSAGPAVVVEAANTLPVAYVEAGAGAVADVVGSVVGNGGASVSIENIDYDYLYNVGAGGGVSVDAVVGSARERQLDFCML